MSKNALLEAPIGSDRRTTDSYHAPMDGNGPIQPTPAPPHQWHQPPYPPAPAPAAGRRWIPAAIISAGIIIAGSLVGGAVLLSNGNKTEANTAVAGGQPAANAAADSSTCQAWKTTAAALDQIPTLPRGWDWDTPNIDTLIANRNTAMLAVLEQFTPQIAADPADVAEAANRYVSEKRREATKLADHTMTAADQGPGTVALDRLNRLCGLSD
ncbi:MAG: hypothetical protein O2892_17710 [Actinomycetota bacterium]|nr:hypothetical protein [Actinomycetota bacterium]MDA2950846.1 hypothetical protein [Actinomycetota bacterium]